MNEIILAGLRNMEDTILITDSDNKIIYSNHDMVEGQKFKNRNTFKHEGKWYVATILGFPKERAVEEIDDLTGLLTKGAFKERIVNFDSDRAVVVFCDIDNLKHFNTVYGHLETDKVIYTLAMIIKQSTRATDAIGKFGGDEFVMLLKDTSVQESYPRIEEIRKRINDHIFTLKNVETGEYEEVRASMTFGIAEVVNNNIKGAFREADDILMDGKKTGKNMVYTKRRERKM